jgi:hypothetical protein
VNSWGSSSPVIRNSIIWDNSSTFSGISPTVTYSIVQSWTGGGTGNSSTAPGFITSPSYANAPFNASVNYNYRLSAASGPAYNNGNNDSYPVTSGGAWNTSSPAYSVINALSADAKAKVLAALRKDLGGADRYIEAIDIGAYEKQ